ncbi:MAG: metallophosphoesterase [Pseudomonadota bacterium]
MKLHILSDIHVEFEAFVPPSTDADVIVLAGDIHVGRKGLDWALEQFPDKPVIYVLGNHEYYGKAVPKLTNELKEIAADTNVHLLERSSVELGGVTFLGSTLWTDFELLGDPRIAGYEAQRKMTDFKKIRVSPKFSRLRSVDASVMHYRSKKWIQDEVKKAVGDVVVVTHHGPSAKSLPQHYRDDLLSAAYVSNMDDFVSESGAALWIHGHIHSTSDYRLGNTRVVCNPRGYPDESNDEFVADFVVKI